MSEGLHPGVHPDPDALNAFLESALPEHERLECLGHLATCAQCREVVFLAQKAAEMEAPVAVRETPVSFWQRLFRPMSVRSMVTAAVVAVVSFGVYRMNRPAGPLPAEPQAKVTASTSAPVETAPAAKVNEQTPESQPAPRTASPRPVRKAPEQPPASSAPALAPAAPSVAVSAPPPASLPPPVAAPPQVASVVPPAPQPAPVSAAQVAEVAGAFGTIVDPAGAVIVSARVELKNEDTGATYTSTSDARGQYSVAELAPGRYDFTVTSPGFKKFVRAGVNVQPQEMARLDSTLDVGAAAESVTVTSEATLLKTESGDVSRQVNSTSVDQLPLLAVGRGSFAAGTPPIPVYTLPDKSTPVSVATKDKLVVATDPAGALFVSENAGKSWMRVRATWKGKVARVGVSANGRFELTTDPASTWVSTDGRRWSEALKSR